MIKKGLVVILGLLLFASPAPATKIASVSLPDTIRAGETKLILNGGGIRKKFMLKLYVGALYLKAKSGDQNKIINADEAMAIKLHITSGMISSEKMMNALTEGFEKSTRGNIAPLKGKIDKFASFFKEKISENDIFDIQYEPGKGVTAKKNGIVKGTVPGLEFKQALFGIWLCNEPADDDLKDGMLGK